MKIKRLKQTGFSLIELMIAAALGVFLMAGMFQIYSANSNAFNMQKASSQIQRSGQFALQTISQKISTAGYMGFYGDMSLVSDNTLKNKNNLKWDISIPVLGFDQVTPSTSIAGINNFVEGTDVLIVKKMVRSTNLINHSDNKTLIIEKGSSVNPGDILFLLGVDQASIFQANDVSTASNITTIKLTSSSNLVTPGNDAFLANAYSANAEVGRLDTRMYYIKIGKNGRPSLFEAILVNSVASMTFQETELASNVLDMQLIYGIDGNQDKVIDEYKEATMVGNWQEVISVGVALSISSSEPLPRVSNNESTFNVDDFTFQNILSSSKFADKKLKRTFRTFTPIRNRVL